jgi:hypothetical protein
MKLSELEASLQAIANQYQQNVGAAFDAAKAAPQVPPGYYLASDGKVYPQQPAPPAPQPAPPPPPAAVAPPPAPLPQPPATPLPQPPAPPSGLGQGYAIPAAVAPLLVQQHLQQPLPINPPEAVQALDPSLPPPAEKKKRGSRTKTTPMQAAANADQAGVSLEELLAGVAGLLPKGCSVTVQGEA